MKGLAPRAPDSDLDEALTLKEPLRYLNVFRLVVAGLFLVAGRSLQLGSESPTLFVATSFAYVAAVLALGFPDSARLIGLRRLVTIQVLVDVTLLTLVMWSSGGYRSSGGSFGGFSTGGGHK